MIYPEISALLTDFHILVMPDFWRTEEDGVPLQYEN